MKKRKAKEKTGRFTDEQAKFLCEALEAHGWTVFHKEDRGIACGRCGEAQEIEWDYCPNCGSNHAENPCEQDTSGMRETIELVRDLVQEAIDT